MKQTRIYHEALKYDADGNEVAEGQHFIEVPCHKEVCPSCGGEGYHFRGDLDETRMREIYAEDGRDNFNPMDYSVRCTTCEGNNVVDAPDWDYAYKHYPEECQRMSEWDSEMYESSRYAAQERACGA
jgi:hypothetical protein